MAHHHHKETHRLEKTFKDFLDANKPKFDEIDQTNKQIETELNNMKFSILDLIRTNCAQQMQWLDEHGTIYFDEHGINVHVNSNPDGFTADAMLADLDVCASNNDLGLKNFFTRANASKDFILRENHSCINKCTFRSEDKTDIELSKCIQNCFDDSFGQTDDLLKEIKDKIHEVKKNLSV